MIRRFKIWVYFAKTYKYNTLLDYLHVICVLFNPSLSQGFMFIDTFWDIYKGE